MYTASSAILDALVEAGVEYLFANFGSDHPGLIEAIAQARAANRPCPKVITAPTEMVAMSAAHGFAQARGRAQAVLVHVDCGTQALGGAVHNAAKGRVPVLIIAGMSPATQEGEARGSRNEFIQWIQDVPDQRGLVRGYVRYENEIRVGRQCQADRASRAAVRAQRSARAGVRHGGARSARKRSAARRHRTREQWQPVAPAGLNPDAAREIARRAGRRGASADRDVVRRADRAAAVEELVALAEQFGIGVIESVPNYVNFPTTHPCYLGVQWNERRQNEALAQADLVLVIDSDVPWIGAVSRPRADARIIHIDADPLKQQMPLWYIGATLQCQADAALALRADPRRARGVRAGSRANPSGARGSWRPRTTAWHARGPRARAAARRAHRRIPGGLHPRCHRRGRHRGQRSR